MSVGAEHQIKINVNIEPNRCWQDAKSPPHPLIPSALSLCLGLAISKMSTYQAPGSLLDKGIGPGQGVTGRDGCQGDRRTRIRAKTMRISINKEAKRRHQQQQRQWVWLQQKQRKKKKQKRQRLRQGEGNSGDSGGVIIYQTRTHKGQVKCYPCSYQGKHGRGSRAAAAVPLT